MKRKTKLFLLAVVSYTATMLNAQSYYVHQAVIVNEGSYDYVNEKQIVPVSVGSYSPETGIYHVFDTISEMRWASDALIDDKYIYVAGDTPLNIYNKDNYTREAQLIIKGVRKLAFWNDNILVSRMSGAGYGAYFQAYDRNTFSLEFELDTVNGPAYSSEGMVVLNDTCYLAVNNAFHWGNYKSLLGLIDMKNRQYVSQIDFGTDALNPDNVMVQGGKIITLNNRNWDSTGSSITVFDVADRTFQNFMINASAGGCGSSVAAFDHVYYQKYTAEDSLLRFNVSTKSTESLAENVPGYLYGMAADTINNLIYATSTDYYSYGKAYLMQNNGALLDSFSVGISPGSIALDIRVLTGYEKTAQDKLFFIYPNPASGEVHFRVFNNNCDYSVAIVDMLGRKIWGSNFGKYQVETYHELKDFDTGNYIVELSMSGNHYFYRLQIKK